MKLLAALAVLVFGALVGCGPSTAAGNTNKMPTTNRPPTGGGSHPPGFTPPAQKAGH